MKIKYLSILPVVAIFTFLGISLAHADVFADNLYYGLQNNSQVSQLQDFLTSQGLYSGPITGNFYFLTLHAVKAFQSQQDITPASGYFGPITMAAANKIADAEIGASSDQAISETGTSTPPVQGSSTIQLQLQALLQDVALLQQQLTVQQSSTQAIQNLQTQAQQQTQTIQQIQQNTQAIQQNTTPSISVAPATPSATPSASPSASPSPNPPPAPTPTTPTPTTTASISIINPTNTNSPFYVGYQINFLVILTDSNGNIISNATMTVTTDDASQNIAMNGIASSPLVGYSCGANKPCYGFAYTPKTLGTHTITVSALGATQSVTITSTTRPVPRVTVSLYNYSPEAGNIPLGTLGSTLAMFRFTETSNLENARINELTITDTVTSTGTSTSPGFSNLQLWGSSPVGTAGVPIPVPGTTSSYTYTFDFGVPNVVPAGNSSVLILKGDATSPGSSNVFSIANASSVYGQGDSDSAPVSFTVAGVTGKPQTVVSQ